MKKRVLLLRDGNFFMYVHQVANLLIDAGHDVQIVFTANQQVEPLYTCLVDELRGKGVPIEIILDPPSKTVPARALAKLSRIKNRFITGQSSVMSGNKIRRAKQCVQPANFDIVIAFDPAALFLATNLFTNELAKVINFSLEVWEETHPAFQANWELRNLVRHERRVLPRIGGLMIQDRFREQILLERTAGYDRVKTIYFPVAIPGPKIATQKTGSPAVVLFYGGIWSEELVAPLRLAARQLSHGMRLVVRGGRGLDSIGSTADTNFVMDRTPIPFSELDSLFSQADIGIALYPGTDKNSRTTAFSSEKIARYTKAGMPFIAFDNADYRHLKANHDCCYLIRDYHDLSAAIESLCTNYERHRQQAYNAYDEFYCLEHTSHAFLESVSRW